MVSWYLSTSPKKQRELFFSLKSPRDLADLLEISYSQLVYNIFKVSDADKYTIFNIPKKAGGYRTINSPISSIKIIQWKLNEILLNVYSPKPSVYSYVKNRNIDHARAFL